MALLNCGLLVPSRVIRMPIGSESSTLSRRATPRCVLSLPAGRRSCRPTFWHANSRTSVHPSQTSKSWRVRVNCIQPTTLVLLVRNPTLPPTKSDKSNSVGRAACLLNHEPGRIYVPLLMCPWIMQACHSTASCHLGTTHTLRMLERFYLWIGMNVCTRWWLRHCLKCQARKTPRLTVRWPIISMFIPEGSGVAVSVDYFGPLPVTPRGNIYILLFTDRFSRRADMFPVTAAEFTAEGTPNILVNHYVPLWGCSRTILSDNRLQFCSKLSQAVYQLLGVHKLATSSHHPNCNGGVEWVNHTVAQMLALVVNERQDDWYLHLPHVKFAHNNSVSAATGLAPNEVHMGRLPRSPLTVFDRTGVVGHQSLTRDHLVYYDLATDRQKRANDIVRAHHALTVSRVNRINSALADALRPAPNFATGGWACMYNSASTIRQGVKANADAKVLKAKLALNWTGPSKILAVGPCAAAETPDGSPLGSNLLYLDLPSDLPGSDACRRVAIKCCKPCANPRDIGDMPNYLPAGLTQYVLN